MLQSRAGLTQFW